MGRRSREDDDESYEPGSSSKKARNSTPIDISSDSSDVSEVEKKQARTKKKGKAKVVVVDSDSDASQAEKKARTKKKSTKGSKTSARTVRKKEAQKTTLDLGNPAATENERLCLIFDHALHIHRDFDLPAKVKNLEESLLAAESKATVSELELKRLEKERGELEVKLKAAATQLDQAADRVNEAESKAEEAERDLTRMLQRLAPGAPRQDDFMHARPHERNTSRHYTQVFYDAGADQDHMTRDSQAGPALRRRTNENSNRGGYTRRMPARMPLRDQNYTDSWDFEDTDNGAACYDEDYSMHD